MNNKKKRIQLSYKFNYFLDKFIYFFNFKNFFRGNLYYDLQALFLYDDNTSMIFDAIEEYITSILKVEHEKFYPKANEWMWDYCIFFKKFTSKNGREYDLGIYTGEKYVSCAIVYSNNPGDYNSNDFRRCKDGTEDRDFILETYKIALEKGYNI